MITLTDLAIHRIRELKQKFASQILRVRVVGGGCKGFSYQYALVDGPSDSDLVVHQDDVVVLIEARSAEYVKGAQLSYEGTLGMNSFVMRNPNSKSSCGCGKSFTS